MTPRARRLARIREVSEDLRGSAMIAQITRAGIFGTRKARRRMFEDLAEINYLVRLARRCKP